MLRRHSQLRDHVVKFGDVEIDALLENPAIERKSDYMVKQREVLDDANKRLQRADGTVRTARAYFDEILEEYYDLCDCLDADARSVHDPHSKVRLLKIQEMHEALLNILEKAKGFWITDGNGWERGRQEGCIIYN